MNGYSHGYHNPPKIDLFYKCVKPGTKTFNKLKSTAKMQTTTTTTKKKKNVRSTAVYTQVNERQVISVSKCLGVK